MINLFECFNNGKLNGLDIFIMQSDENYQKVIKRAEYYNTISSLDRARCATYALNDYKLSLKQDFTDGDKKRIEDWIREV